ncbi:MAG: HU family DNA-binding protein [Candidatus Geothermincolia bacterium]
MNKAQLIDDISSKTKLSKKDVGTVVDAMVETITKALKKADRVTLVGFGTFECRKRKARKGVNPRTGETIKIAACKVPAFRPGASLKAAIGPKKKA